MPISEEGVVDGVKNDEDETTVELFRRIREDVAEAAKHDTENGVIVVKEGMLWLPRLVRWLEAVSYTHLTLPTILLV